MISGMLISPVSCRCLPRAATVERRRSMLTIAAGAPYLQVRNLLTQARSCRMQANRTQQ
jgi:hypothetical protein